MNNILFNFILLKVCSKYNISEKDIFSRCRKVEIVEKKQILFYLLVVFDRKYTLENITDYIKFKSGISYNHATILHSKKQILNRMSVYPEFKKEILSLRYAIKYLMKTKANSLIIEEFDLLQVCQSQNVKYIN